MIEIEDIRGNVSTFNDARDAKAYMIVHILTRLMLNLNKKPMAEIAERGIFTIRGSVDEVVKDNLRQD